MQEHDKQHARALLAGRARSEYETGLTVMQVAEELSVSYGKAYALIKEACGSIRPRGTRFAPRADT